MSSTVEAWTTSMDLFYRLKSTTTHVIYQCNTKLTAKQVYPKWHVSKSSGF